MFEAKIKINGKQERNALRNGENISCCVCLHRKSFKNLGKPHDLNEINDKHFGFRDSRGLANPNEDGVHIEC